VAWLDKPSLEAILESITLWWLTETYPRAIYPYREVNFPNFFEEILYS
jgi:microsomal epoxide hydrolase